MSDVGRILRQAYEKKPKGMPLSDYTLDEFQISSIKSQFHDAAVDSAYAAVLSFSEALSGLSSGSTSWPIVKLYYSCYYSLKSTLLFSSIAPFMSKEQILFDAESGRFFKGGQSSHNWNWRSFERIECLTDNWIFSEDSRVAYEALRGHRENVNYTHGFTDPNFHRCLPNIPDGLEKSICAYRDDEDFIYTYLQDHLMLSYPTKVVFSLGKEMSERDARFAESRCGHIGSVWPLRSRGPGVL